jgi:hypothetical protein
MKRFLAVASAWLVLACGTVALGQIHGVPPSVTSLGRVGSFPPGVAPSVTSLGPMGWQVPCCAIGGGFTFGQPPFVGSGFGSGFGFHHHHHHQFDNGMNGFGMGANAFGSFYMPMYIPYYPYVPLYSADMNGGDDPAYAPAATAVVRTQPADPPTDRYLQQRSADAESPAPAPQPVKASAPREQDPTILVFRDGHQIEVRNYAIVGKTLYSFDSGTRKYPLSDIDLDATRKINDDHGNEFHLPGQ